MGTFAISLFPLPPPLPTPLTPPRFLHCFAFRRPNPSPALPPLPSAALSPSGCRLNGIPSKSSRLWRVPASSGDVMAPEEVVEKTQQMIPAAPASDGIGSTVVAFLLSIAFVGLSILTIGVVYIAVTDFLQKREGEKFEKEETAKRKKGKKKVKARAKTGPRGFGQKIEEDDD